MAEDATNIPVKKSEAPAKFHDWAPFESLRREVERLFDDWMPSRRLFDFELPRVARANWQFAPAMDVVEKDDAFEITAELPGLDEKDVEVKLANQTLTIKGEKSEEREDKQKDYYLSERRYGSFQRSFRVPDSVDPETIEAKFAKGVLTVKMPKTAEAKAEKKIDIKAG